MDLPAVVFAYHPGLPEAADLHEVTRGWADMQAPKQHRATTVGELMMQCKQLQCVCNCLSKAMSVNKQNLTVASDH